MSTECDVAFLSELWEAQGISANDALDMREMKTWASLILAENGIFQENILTQSTSSKLFSVQRRSKEKALTLQWLCNRNEEEASATRI